MRINEIILFYNFLNPNVFYCTYLNYKRILTECIVPLQFISFHVNEIKYNFVYSFVTSVAFAS